MKACDHQHMMTALALARQGAGQCAPNPSVGAVLVDVDQRVIAEGWHKGAGLPHAEVNCLNQVDEIPPDATLYITLEPCCHEGRTPPCTQLIIERNIQRVVFGYWDPNPKVNGQGQSTLQAARIICDHVSLPEVETFYGAYQQWQSTGLPWITAKLALTMYGEYAGQHSKPVKITGEQADALTHLQRKQHDAVLTSVQTIIADDPALNARIDGRQFSKKLYVLDRQLRFPVGARVFETMQEVTCFYSERFADRESLQRYQRLGIRGVPINEISNQLDLLSVWRHVGEAGLHRLWVEAGAQLYRSLLRDQHVSELMIYFSRRTLVQPGMISPIHEGWRFDENWHRHWSIFGEDLCCHLRRPQQEKKICSQAL